MNPELLAAVKERISLGHSKEAITAALEAAGYDRATIEHVYAEAKQEHERTAIPLADGHTGGQFMPSAAATALPSGLTLFKAGWRYMLTRLDLVAALGVLLAILTVGEFLFADPAAVPGEATVAIILGSVAAIVAYLFVVLGSLYVVMQSDVERLSLGAGISWAKSHIWGFLWVSLLTLLVVFGGLLLFIIPGLVVSLYLYFAQYVFVKEDVRGMDALLRSTQLVLGSWWALFWRFLVLGFLSFLAMLPVVIVTEVVAESVDHSVANLIVAVVTQLFAAAVTVITLYAVAMLYAHLATARPVGTLQPMIAVWKYKALVVLGVVCVFLLLGLGIMGATMQDVIGEQSKAMMTAHMIETVATTELYRTDTGSYEGVCEEVTSFYVSFGDVVCNDAPDAWAMTVESESGEWCIDSTGFMKEIPTTLGERTKCVDL